MDKKHKWISRDPVVITGIGVEAPESLSFPLLGQKNDLPGKDLSHDCLPLKFLKQKKTLKFMSKQDRLAVNAAGQAISSAALTEDNLRHDTSVFLTVGFIPFEHDIADDLCANSTKADQFSMKKFSTVGIDNINPLLAFACLPNMPAHHIAMNFGINGEYHITYPDILQLYLALDEAIQRLEEGRNSFALVGGVTDQNNFLVAHHFQKTIPALVDRLADAAGFMVLEKESSARARKASIMARLDSLQVYASSPLVWRNDYPQDTICSGPAQLVVDLSNFIDCGVSPFCHCLSEWENRTYSTWTKA